MKRIQAEQNTILLSLTGSRLYGIENEDSDYDYKGICIPSIEYFIGTKTFEQLHAFLEFLYTLIKDAAQYHVTTVELLEKIELKGLLKERKLPEEVLDCVQYYTRATNDFMTLLRGNQAYRAALQEYEAYQSWKNNRNSTRAEIEAKCGYDGKHMGHCYRLLQTGIEILSGEGVQPDRRVVGDAEYIKSIRNGGVDYDDVKQNVDALLLKLEKAKQNTRLPKTPDTKTIEQVQIDILKSSLGIK